MGKRIDWDPRNTPSARRRRTILSAGVLVALFTVLSLFLDGMRLTPTQAVMAGMRSQSPLEVFAQVDRPWGSVLLMKSGEGLKSAVVDKYGILWHCGATTRYYDEAMRNDAVKTVGLVISSTPRGEIAILAVKSETSKIARVDAGPQGQRQSREISEDEIVVFDWDHAIPWGELDAVAYNAEGAAAYEYRYPTSAMTLKGEDLRWWPVDD